MTWDELDLDQRMWSLSEARTKNGKLHLVNLSDLALSVVQARPKTSSYVFAASRKQFGAFSRGKRELDERSGVRAWHLHDLRRTAVSGMARLGVAPHVADKILNHTTGTIAGVAAVYQRHEFMAERKAALELWSRPASSG